MLSFGAKTPKLLLNKTSSCKHIDVFERNIQSNDMLKSLCGSLVVLTLQICLTQPPAMVFHQ